jgi:hypothetical protein
LWFFRQRWPAAEAALVSREEAVLVSSLAELESKFRLQPEELSLTRLITNDPTRQTQRAIWVLAPKFQPDGCAKR